MADTSPRSGYAPVNGLKMYYEIHGDGQPLVLLHGALSATGTSFGALLPALAEHRQVVAVELQAHGRTADADRPLDMRQLADDTDALLEHLGIEQADVLGYSLGAGVALELVNRHPRRVRKLVLISASFNTGGLHPGVLDGIDMITPEALAGTPFADEYARTAPNPGDWPKLIEKIKQLDRDLPEWPAERIQEITAPTLLIIGDSDIVRPEHAVEMFRLLGGGVAGDNVGLPNSRLAIVPGATHITVVYQADVLLPMIGAFLDAPMSAGAA
jgi:pimeloyl-ACP methyl ester carboxylesterase